MKYKNTKLYTIIYKKINILIYQTKKKFKLKQINSEADFYMHKFTASINKENK